MPFIHAAQSVRVLGAGSLAHWEKSITVETAESGLTVVVTLATVAVRARVGAPLAGSVACKGRGSGVTTGAVAVAGLLVGTTLPLSLIIMVGVASLAPGGSDSDTGVEGGSIMPGGSELAATLSLGASLDANPDAKPTPVVSKTNMTTVK
jgi:hypothetical protein